MIYLDVEDLLHIADQTLANVDVRDVGLLESAAARPRASVFGEDAYVAIHEKAAALIHSIARNHALVDGNKRTWHPRRARVIIAIAAGELDDVERIAETLRRQTEPRPPMPADTDGEL